MSKHRFPEITKANTNLFQESFKFKPRRKMALFQNPPAPIIAVNDSSYLQRQASFFSDSPYAHSQSLSKIRSSSVLTLNDKTPIKLRSVSSELKKNYTNSRIQLKHKKGKEASVINCSNKSLSSIDSTQKISKSKTPTGNILSLSNSFTTLTQDSRRILTQSKNDAESLENKLLKKLKKIEENDSESIMDNDKFNIYRKIFIEVIEKDKTYGSLLRQIKDGYEEWISVWKNSENNLCLQEEANDLNKKVKELLEDRKLTIKKIEKLAKENAGLSRSLEESESGYAKLHERLLLISNIKTDDMPKDEDSWKYIVAENKILVDMCRHMKEQLKKFQTKEKKLLKLISELKNRGYPVEEVYEKCILKRKIVKEEKTNNRERNSGENDEELLISGPPRKVEKPEIVPTLDLNNINHEKYYSESSGYSSVESES
ncbi:unnamed protein product [Blepharisma stoltei]|uniref:Translin-associated factor X-interacting protein 1 N-terminal domain-containing protein n=1 Tax=Blepharisma stoltei TaxID=1481888 RepID=A0AAU9ILV9_9CILI|nr:unnamed protein product [Blepharisma stoltei]